MPRAYTSRSVLLSLIALLALSTLATLAAAQDEAPQRAPNNPVHLPQGEWRPSGLYSDKEFAASVRFQLKRFEIRHCDPRMETHTPSQDETTSLSIIVRCLVRPNASGMYDRERVERATLGIYNAVFAAHSEAPIGKARIQMIIETIDRYGNDVVRTIYDTVMTGETAAKVNWPNRARIPDPSLLWRTLLTAW